MLNKIPKKTIVFILVFVLLYTVAGFIGVPILAKKYLPQQVSKLIDKEVSIKSATFNPFLFSASIQGIEIKSKDEKNHFFSADKIYTRIGLDSIVKMVPVISELGIENPKADIVRQDDGSIDGFDLNADLSSDEGKIVNAATEIRPEKQAMTMDTLPEFIIKNVAISNGSIRFEDNVASATHQLTDLSFILPYLSSISDKQDEKIGMDLHFILNQSRVDLNLQTTPFAEMPSILALIKTSDIDLVQYLPYAPVPESMIIKSLGLNTDLQLLLSKKKQDFSLELQGTLNVLNFDLIDASDTPVVGFSKAAIDFLPSNILDKKINIRNVVLNSPQLNLIIDDQGYLNLSSLWPESKEADPQNDQADNSIDETSPEFILNLSRFDIHDATMDFQDLSKPTPFETRISSMTALFENIVINESFKTSYDIAFETEANEKINSSGQLNSNPLTAKGNLSISNLLLNKYAPYFEHQMGLDIQQGKMTVDTQFDLGKNQDAVGGKIDIPQFRMESLTLYDRQTKENILHLPKIDINSSQIDFDKKELNTGAINMQAGEIVLKRFKNGQLNIAKAFGVPSSPDSMKKAPVKASPDSWGVYVPLLDLSGLNLHFEDDLYTDPVKINLSNLSIKTFEFKTFGDKQADVSIQSDWNQAGKIQIDGKIFAPSLQADLDIKLDQIDIKSLQPYFTDTVKVMVTNGNVNTQGRVSLDLHKKPVPFVRFKGQSSVTQFVCLDKQSAKDFFKAKSLFFSNLDVSAFPVKVAAKEISLTDFYSRVIVNENGQMNLNSIFKDSSDQSQLNQSQLNQGDSKKAVLKKDTSEEKKIVLKKDAAIKKDKDMSIPEIRVDSVTLQGGQIQFSDYLTKPNFTAEMKALAGSVTGLSSDERSRAKLHLKGIHGQSSPLEIIGSINPLAQTKFADIHVSFKDIELTNFTPYAAKYLGYKIEKGKLILDLEYLINGNTLKSENRVRFDNFALGKRVESKEATSMPVSLAISLLKNKDGQINLDLPVTGELDDPEFSFAGIVFKMIGNLIIKVATSPFAIIGSMFGGGEELEYLDFNPGETTIIPQHMEKLDKLKKILLDRPSIKLEIQGMVDSAKEAHILRERGFEDLIKAEKIKQMLATGSSANSLKEVTISQEEMPVYIYLAYAKASFPKPRNENDSEKQIDMVEKKKLLMTNVLIKKEDLRLLSIQRAQKVKAALLLESKINKERLFILEPTEISEDQNGSQVKFSMK